MHTVLSYETQPFVTADYTIFVAEVASTTNERFLLEQLLQADQRPEGALPAAAARGRFDRRHLLHAGDVRRLRAAGAPPGREGPAGDHRGAERALRRPAQGVLRRRGDRRRLLQVHLGAHPALLQHAVLRLPVRDLLRLVGAALQRDDDRRARVAQGGDRALPDAAQERRQRPSDGAAARRPASTSRSARRSRR